MMTLLLDLWPYVFEHMLKRGAELSTDCQLVVSWIIVRVNWKHLGENLALKIF